MVEGRDGLLLGRKQRSQQPASLTAPALKHRAPLLARTEPVARGLRRRFGGVGPIRVPRVCVTARLEISALWCFDSSRGPLCQGNASCVQLGFFFLAHSARSDRNAATRWMRHCRLRTRTHHYFCAMAHWRHVEGLGEDGGSLPSHSLHSRCTPGCRCFSLNLFGQPLLVQLRVRVRSASRLGFNASPIWSTNCSNNYWRSRVWESMEHPVKEPLSRDDWAREPLSRPSGWRASTASS
ncbi:hypothetical protein EJ04DRAFT_355885 [Polyplosphaeria fusca]|uniref:Uncharacterized protein n=1 Tax=Polyplosphaeria fusca TaxID=682080 RepID=A0A9P4R6Z9_9PLEO|nr:hypothetical protein EJ04DRAFT_355885 [Polyplosphaeria fusca]